MRARRIISDGGFSPEDVTYLTNVLERAWRDVESISRMNGLDREAAREGLALTILYFATRSAHPSAEEFRREVKTRFLESIHLSSTAQGRGGGPISSDAP
jgi:hypothetical protein